MVRSKQIKLYITDGNKIEPSNVINSNNKA